MPDWRRSSLTPKIGASLLAAVAGGILCEAFVQRSGDPQYVVNHVEAELRHVAQLETMKWISDAPQPSEPGRQVFVIEMQKEVGGQRRFSIEGPTAADNPQRSNNHEELIYIVSKIVEEHQPRVMYPPAAWHEFDKVWTSLTPDNKEIAKAKAMRNFTSDPSAFDSYVWSRRFELSSQPWSVQRTTSFYGDRVKYGALSAAVAFTVAFVLLSVLTWTWKFFLERIRELSRAIRGQ